MKDPKELIFPVFQNPISDTDLHKIYAVIETAQIEALNEGVRSAANAFYFHPYAAKLSTKAANDIRSRMLKLIKK